MSTNDLHAVTEPDSSTRYLELVGQRAELRRRLATVEAELEPLEATLLLRLASTTKPAHRCGQESEGDGRERHLDVSEVCKRFRRSKNCIYRWIRDGRIRPVKQAGRPFIFTHDEIDRFEAGFRRHRS